MERFVYNLKSLKFLLSCEYKDCQQNKDFSYVLILWKVKMSFIKLVRCRGQKNVFNSMKKQKYRWCHPVRERVFARVPCEYNGVFLVILFNDVLGRFKEIRAILLACRTPWEVVFGVSSIFLFTPVPYNNNFNKSLYPER